MSPTSETLFTNALIRTIRQVVLSDNSLTISHTTSWVVTRSSLGQRLSNDMNPQCSVRGDHSWRTYNNTTTLMLTEINTLHCSKWLLYDRHICIP